MDRTFISAGFGFLFFLGLGVPEVQAQQPAAAEPQAPSGTVQAPREVVPALPVPRLVKFAGTLNGEQGKPRTGVVGVTFAVYKEQEGGGALWLETQNVHLDEQGRYTVLLGATNSEGLPLELFSAGEPRWLGVQANLPGEVEQARVLLVSVPYALKAADADTLGGIPLSSFVLTTQPSGSGSSKTGNVRGAGLTGAVTIGGGGTANFVTKFDATGANVVNSSISDNGSRITAGEGIDFSSDFSFVGNAEPASTGRVQMFDRANVGFVLRGLNLLVETLQGSSFVPTEVMRWTQAGNVGIGTAAPGQKLSVAGVIESTSGGFKFPDGTSMTTAGNVQLAQTPSCTTGSAAGSACSTTVSWPLPYADTNYTATCTLETPSSNGALVLNYMKAPSELSVNIANLTSGAASGTINCMGIQNGTSSLASTSVTGHWLGTCTDGGLCSGNMVADLVQSNVAVMGTIQLLGGSCGGNNTVFTIQPGGGTLVNGAINMVVQANGNDRLDFAGSVIAGGLVMNGSLSTALVCGGIQQVTPNGTWSMTKQ